MSYSDLDRCQTALDWLVKKHGIKRVLLLLRHTCAVNALDTAWEPIAPMWEKTKDRLSEAAKAWPETNS